MGIIKKDLSRIKLPDRDLHDSRLFVDLCENIHIHYREFRIVFSLDEYFEFVDIVSRATEDVRSYLAQNPEYQERAHPNTVMYGGGKKTKKKLLRNSPKPNESAYFANDFAIELQDESVVDEIHVHWRDYRFAISREHFKMIADSFTEAKKELEQFEAKYDYKQHPHGDRSLEDFQKELEKYEDYEARIIGEEDISLDKISAGFDESEKAFNPDPKTIDILFDAYKNEDRVPPVILSTENDKKHKIIDGYHRYYAAKKADLTSVNCIVTELTVEESKPLRKAESLLKKFDRETGNRYNTSGFVQKFFAHRASRFYKDHFYKLLLYHSDDHFYKLPYITRFDKMKFSLRKWFNNHPKIKSAVKKFG